MCMNDSIYIFVIVSVAIISEGAPTSVIMSNTNITKPTLLDQSDGANPNTRHSIRASSRNFTLT
jgi:hypothetical protein